MTQFKDLDKGDMFNTKPERYVKIDDHRAISVYHHPGEIVVIAPDFEVIPLYSKKLDTE